MWRYVIVNYNNVTQEMADMGGYTSPEYMCKSKNNNVVVKWKGNKPHCLYGMEEIDIKTELQKDEWRMDDNE